MELSQEILEKIKHTAEDIKYGSIKIEIQETANYVGIVIEKKDRLLLNK